MFTESVFLLPAVGDHAAAPEPAARRIEEGPSGKLVGREEAPIKSVASVEGLGGVTESLFLPPGPSSGCLKMKRAPLWIGTDLNRPTARISCQIRTDLTSAPRPATKISPFVPHRVEPSPLAWQSDPVRIVVSRSWKRGDCARKIRVIDYQAMFTSILAFTFPPVSLVLGWFLFGCLGMIAVGYAKMKREWPPAALGVGLMVYPYFFPSGIAFWAVGLVLTVLLLLPKRILGW